MLRISVNCLLHHVWAYTMRCHRYSHPSQKHTEHSLPLAYCPLISSECDICCSIYQAISPSAVHQGPLGPSVFGKESDEAIPWIHIITRNLPRAYAFHAYTPCTSVRVNMSQTQRQTLCDSKGFPSASAITAYSGTGERATFDISGAHVPTPWHTFGPAFSLSTNQSPSNLLLVTTTRAFWASMSANLLKLCVKRFPKAVGKDCTVPAVSWHLTGSDLCTGRAWTLISSVQRTTGAAHLSCR